MQQLNPALERSIPPARFVEREACPACGSSHSHTLLIRPYNEGALRLFLTRYYSAAENLDAWLEGGTYQLERCAACQLVFQRFVGSEPLLSALYDRWLNNTYYPGTPAFLAQVGAPSRTRDGHELFAAAHALGRPVPRLRVLDYGMGWGLWAQIAKRLGAQVFGYDLSKRRREHARSKGISVVAPEAFAEVQADFINADQILEHVTEPLAVVSQLASAVRPGGIVKISVPRARDIVRRLEELDWDAPKGSRSSLHVVQPLEHVNCFDSRSLEALCGRVGLRRIAVPWAAYGAFARVPGAIPWADPRRLAKSLLRPAYHKLSSTKLYAWFVR